MALQTALTASEARSEQGFVQEIPKTAGEKIRRLWHNIDASVADTLISSAEAIGTSGWTLVSVNNNEAIIRRNGEVRSVYIGQKF